LGAEAGVNLTTGRGNVCLGAFVYGNAGESNTTRIRNVYSSVASDRAVYVTADNKIGTLVSSRRFKEEIKPMDKASEAILALKPVSFRYKKEIESNGSIMFGLIAEDVEKADPDLVTRDEKGQAETVRYDAVNAMLLNEFLKEHQKNEGRQGEIEEQGATISQLKSTLAQQQKRFESKLAQQEQQIAALTADLQRLAADIQLNKAEARAVAGR
jgi:ribosomal protein S15P/S13E